MGHTKTAINQHWPLVSGGAAAIGALIADFVFPEAGFAQNPTALFGWHLVGFASIVGISLAVGQWLILQKTYGKNGFASAIKIAFWLPVTTTGIVAMVFPLWYLDAVVLSFMPIVVVVPMMPGIVLLGVAQWVVLYSLIQAKNTWILMTIAGATLGAVVGLILALFLPLPVEATWAGVTGLGIGVFQGTLLPTPDS